MKRLALLLTISALASASLVRLPEAGDAVGTVDVDAELQRVFAPGGSSTKGSNAGTQGEGDNDKDAGIGADGAGLNLADILTVERRASLWWDYARDVASVTSRLTRKGETTLLVPVDRAIIGLPQKPHQNPDGTPASDKQFADNIEAFLSAHIVPGPLTEGKATDTLHADVQVTLEGKEDAWVVQPGDIAVLGVSQASNGRVYYLDGVVGY